MHITRSYDALDHGLTCLERSLVWGFVADAQARGPITLAAIIHEAEIDAAAYPEWCDDICALVIRLQMLTPEVLAALIHDAEEHGR
jgi:hypothetical protein